MNKEPELIVIDQASALAGVAKFECDYLNEHKLYRHLTLGIQLLANCKTNTIAAPHIDISASYEPLDVGEGEEFDGTQIYINAIKRAPFISVTEFAFKHKGSAAYLSEKFLEAHNKNKGCDDE